MSACDWFVLLEVGFIAVMTYCRYRTDGRFELIGLLIAILSTVIYLNYRTRFAAQQKGSFDGDLEKRDEENDWH